MSATEIVHLKPQWANPMRLAKAVAFALFLFVDPMVLSRVAFGDDRIGGVFYLLLGAIVLFSAGRRCLSRRMLFGLDTALLAAYAFAAIYVRIRAGQSTVYLLHYIIVLSQVCVLFLLARKWATRRLIFDAYLVAALLHLVAVVPWIDVIQTRLASTTAYDTGAYELGVLSRRATGFFNSPGQLSLFAIGGVALGIFKSRRHILRHEPILLFLCTMLGVAALSRSFFVTFLLLIIFYFFRGGARAMIRVVLVGCVVVAILAKSTTFIDYVELTISRLESVGDANENDRLSGETGLFEAVKVLVRYPLVGNPRSEDGGPLFAWNGEMLVRPHTAFVQILAIYGVIFSAPLLILIIMALQRLCCRSFVPVRYTWGAGFVAVNIVCLVEPLIETSVYFLFLALLLCPFRRESPFPPIGNDGGQRANAANF